MPAPLPKPLRAQLENTVKAARDVAETAARAVLTQLGVGEAHVPDYLSDQQKALRRRLRAHGRSLGDAKHGDDAQELRHLVGEVAYEHWHRMLFARFLAENGLLLWEPGAPVSLDDCRDMVAHHPDLAMGAKSQWELAGKLAARMLPQVFKPRSPVFELRFAPEHQRDLEKLLAALPTEVFQASDSLGWVYQFWQAKRKDEVNLSEVKIGADELPAVTQLFTEPYMVEFLLHNSLGAWWHTRHPDKLCPVALTYYRTLEDGTPAAGKFEGWPDSLAHFKLLDPCCGSGHFLVAAFLMLVPMRMAAEGLSAQAAVDAVLRDNLYGLEIDPRCVEIAVFALALAAWRYPNLPSPSGRGAGGEGAGSEYPPLGVRPEMPAPNIACCGLKVAAKPQDWEALVPNDLPHAPLLRQELRLLHSTFKQAPLLGSLLDPSRSLKNDLATSSFETLKGLLEAALSSEQPGTLFGRAEDMNEEAWDHALSARGLLEAARLLDGRYHLVITNVPYLARGKQNNSLKDYCETHYPEAKNDLANVFFERCLELALPNGISQIIIPYNWLFLATFKLQRKRLLNNVRWKFIARLGYAAFQIMDWWAFDTALITVQKTKPKPGEMLHSVDASSTNETLDKPRILEACEILTVSQSALSNSSDGRILLEEPSQLPALETRTSSRTGLQTGDNERYSFKLWEFPGLPKMWAFFQRTTSETQIYGGMNQILRWESGMGALSIEPSARVQGIDCVGKRGVLVHRMGQLPACLYGGEIFDQNGGVLIPRDEGDLPAIWSYVASESYAEEVRKLDGKVGVTPATLAKVPFDIGYWRQIASERYPDGLPKPYSDDPTQWIFHGHPQPSTDPLQVAVARLLGYTWPAESDQEMELSDEARQWIARCQLLARHTDDDGIVCLPAVRGEKPAHERLLALLIDAWETVEPGSWKPATLDKLLAEADCAGKSLEVWLREKFFEQHAKRFHHRPFIWHVWDGLKDGFGALVNYHRLDARKLERLIHTYLGDWIRLQEAGVANGIDGAPQRLAAAQVLKKKLEAILEGETPYDIFVRWKPLQAQPIGWNPDLNDGVRLNIRPFMTAEVLRHNKPPRLNIKWDKDRGQDVESAPWYQVFKGERINDHHLTLAEKRAARE